MGFQERRAIHQLRDETLPACRLLLQQRTGGAQIAWTVDWDSLETCDRAALAKVEPLALRVLVEAIAELCVDDFGMAAVKEGISEVRLKQDGSVDTVAIALVNGLLNARFNFQNLSESNVSVEAVRQAIEDGL